MKKKFIPVSIAKFWNRLVKKFQNLYKKIISLLRTEDFSYGYFKFLFDRLQKVYLKLEKLASKTGVKIAGTTIALMFSVISTNAQTWQNQGRVRVILNDAPYMTIGFNDFNNDNVSDLAVGLPDGRIAVFRNEGNGDFVPQGYLRDRTYRIIDINSVALISFADFDNDGDKDLFIGTYSFDNNIYIFRNTNSGFEAFDTLNTNSPYFSYPAFADLDNDGDLDLFVGTYYGNVLIFDNDGNGNFSYSGKLYADGQPLTVNYYATPTFGDIDNDGDLDLLVGSIYGYVYQFINNNGDFSYAGLLYADNEPIYKGWLSLPKLYDLDDDGDVDLFLGTEYPYISEFKNNDGQFSFDKKLEKILVAGEVARPTFFDLDKDNDLDLFIGRDDGKILYVKQNDEGKFEIDGFLKVIPLGGGSPVELSVNDHSTPEFADLDNDGQYELFVGTGWRYDGYIFKFSVIGKDSILNDRSALRDMNNNVIHFGNYYSSPTFADIDHDGDMDLFIGFNYFYYYYAPIARVKNLQNEFEEDDYVLKVLSPFSADGQIVEIPGEVPKLVDIDNDGDYDLVVGDYYGKLYLFENLGDSLFTSKGAIKDMNNILIDVGWMAAPAFVYDKNTHCISDMFVGSYNGYIYHYKFVDTTAPVVPQLPDITAECSVSVPIPTAYDNCSGIVQGTTSDTLYYDQLGDYTIHWTFTDQSGNTSYAVQYVHVVDTTPPYPVQLPDLTLQCPASVPEPTTYDNCAGTIIGTTNDQTYFDQIGNYTITWTFDDGNGNSYSTVQNITVVDSIAPTVVCQSDIYIQLDTADFYTVNGDEFDPYYYDNCTVDSVVNDFNNSSTLAGEQFQAGQYTINWYVYDKAGNVDSCQTIITVAEPTLITANYGLKIYPNPANSVINIDLGQLKPPALLEIYDINGRVVYSEKIVSSQTNVDLSYLQSGIYTIKITNEQSSQVLKIVKN